MNKKLIYARFHKRRLILILVSTYSLSFLLEKDKE